MRKSKINRRQFMVKSASAIALAVGFPYIISASAIGGNNSVAPSNRITMGCVGMGSQGVWNMKAFLEEPDVQVLAVCDVDKNHLMSAKRLVDEKYANKDCNAYNDFRDLISRSDIDTVLIGTPDHWHAIPAIASAKSGKDIFGEKPIAHKLKQGRAICDAVEKYQRVWQTGSWQRSVTYFVLACHLVRSGQIGKVKFIEVTLPSGHIPISESSKLREPCSPPPELDYDMWLGPAAYSPYCPARVHRNWRWLMDYGGGQLMDWIGHHADIGLWALDMDNVAPIEVEASGTWPKDGLWDAPLTFDITAKYANGLIMNIKDLKQVHYDFNYTGTTWHGDNGWISVTRRGMTASDSAVLRQKGSLSGIQNSDMPFPGRASHHRNFIDCVKTRSQTVAPALSAHNATIPAHLGLIAMQLNRKIRFDPQTEQIIGDSAANRLLDNPLRSPWNL